MMKWSDRQTDRRTQPFIVKDGWIFKILYLAFSARPSSWPSFILTDRWMRCIFGLLSILKTVIHGPGFLEILRNTCCGQVARGSFKFGWKEHNFSFNFQYWWLLQNSIELFPRTSSLIVLDIFILRSLHDDDVTTMMWPWWCDHDDVRWPTDGGVTGNQVRGQGSRGH